MKYISKLYINRIEYALCIPEREKFWTEEGYEIKDYKEPRLQYDE